MKFDEYMKSLEIIKGAPKFLELELTYNPATERGKNVPIRPKMSSYNSSIDWTSTFSASVVRFLVLTPLRSAADKEEKFFVICKNYDFCAS